MSEEQQQLDNSTLEQEDFRERYRRVISTLVLMCVVAIVLTIGLIYMSVNRQEARYYATTTSGNVIPLQTLNEPVVSDSYLIQWAALSVRSSFNLDFIHLQANLKSARKYFTNNGFTAFVNALKTSKVLQTIKDSKLVSSAVVTKSPVILNKEIIGGRYSWEVQMPVLVTYTSASASTQQELIATLMIQRVPVLGVAEGIQITTISLQPNIPGETEQKSAI